MNIIEKIEEAVSQNIVVYDSDCQTPMEVSETLVGYIKDCVKSNDIWGTEGGRTLREIYIEREVFAFNGFGTDALIDCVKILPTDKAITPFALSLGSMLPKNKQVFILGITEDDNAIFGAC